MLEDINSNWVPAGHLCVHLVLSLSLPSPVCSHACTIVSYTTSDQAVRPFCSIELALTSPCFPRPANRYRDAQLIHAGKGYGIMYSIWGRFRDIIERGPRLTEMNPLLLSPLQVQI